MAIRAEGPVLLRTLARTPRLEKRRRQGAVVLVIVLALIIILAAWAFSMTFYSRGAAAQSGRAQFRERCTDLAQMAILEAIHTIRTQVNDPSHGEVFEAFRASNPPDLELALSALPRTSEEAERFPAYSVSDVDISIPRRTSIGVEAEERVPYEAVGIASFTVTVSGPESSQVTRSEEYGFRSVLTAPPRPLDMLTFFIRDPRTLLTKGAEGRDPNATINWIAEKTAEIRGRLATWAGRAKYMADLAGQAGYSSSQQKMAALEQAFKNSHEIKPGAQGFWPMPSWKLVQPHQSSRGANTLHFFAWPICVYSARDEVDLSHFALPVIVGQMRELAKGHNGALDQQNQLMTAMWNKYNGMSKPPPESEVQSDIQQLENASKIYIKLRHEQGMAFHNILMAYKVFQDDLIEVGGKERLRIFKRIRRLNAREQPWRNHYSFRGSGAAQQATEFLAQDPPPSGVVYIDDPDNRLQVNIKDLEGRLQIVSRSDVSVNFATVRNPAEDVLIIISYGDLEVSGPVNAALISWAGRYASRGQDFTGSLIMDEVPETTSFASIAEMFKGVVRRQPAIQSGPGGNRKRPPPDPVSLHVAFSPVPPYRRPETR